MTLRLIVTAWAIVLLLTGCAGAPAVRESRALSADAVAERQRERVAWMNAAEVWSFSGRAAISRGGKGGSGRIEWEQRDQNRYRIALSAPVTRQSWQISGDLNSQAGRIEGLEGGPREGGNAESLLLQVTGWQVPLQQLGSWVRGAPSPTYPVQGIVFDEWGRPAGFEQAGWTVRYIEWRPGIIGQPDLPARIDAESGAARVKLIIEDWTFATP